MFNTLWLWVNHNDLTALPNPGNLDVFGMISLQSIPDTHSISQSTSLVHGVNYGLWHLWVISTTFMTFRGI